MSRVQALDDIQKKIDYIKDSTLWNVERY